MYKDLPHSLPYIRSKQKHFHIVGLGFNCLEVGRKVPLTRTPKKEAPLEVEYGFVRTLKVMRMNPVDLRPSDLLRHNLSNDEFKALRAQWIERQKFTHKAKDKNRIVVIWFQYEGCNAATQNCDQVATPAPGSPL